MEGTDPLGDPDSQKAKLIAQVREKIKNYMQLDHVSFFFGTGSSIHLGAAGIQNIPKQIEDDIKNGDKELQEIFRNLLLIFKNQ